MLSEIESIELDDTVNPMDNLRDESYRLSAGFAMGFINLAQGKSLKGLHDMRIVERLLSLAVGTKSVDVVHILDKATAAATVAIALIFMKTEDEALARKIDVPDTIHQFDYVRPDIFLLRTLAKHLIMWEEITPTVAWIENQLPEVFENCSATI
jgi:anaphase-promoting complex subunit 1